MTDCLACEAHYNDRDDDGAWDPFDGSIPITTIGEVRHLGRAPACGAEAAAQ